MSKKSPREKLQGKVAELVDMPPTWVERYGPGKLLIPDPAELETIIKAIPKGSVRTMDDIRAEMAKAHGAAASCPLVSGIFWRLIAEAAEQEGGAERTPWWRVIKNGGKLNEKLPGGIQGHAASLEADGFSLSKSKSGHSVVLL